MITTHDKAKPTKTFSDYILAAGFILFALSILIASNYIGDGMYELSIYTAYPFQFWLLIILSILAGYLRSILDILFIKEGYRWVWGLLLIMITVGFIISLPYFRDYFLNGLWDASYHYSSSLEIIHEGIPNLNDFYPILHILVSVFATFSGLPINKGMTLFPVIFYFIGVCNISVLACVVDKRPEVRGLIIVISSFPLFYFFQGMFYPTQAAVYMLPFSLALLLIARFGAFNWRTSIFFILLLFFLPFLHPLGVITTLLLMVIVFITEVIFPRKQFARFSIERITHPYERISASFFMLLIAWFLWFSTFKYFGMAINIITNAFLYGMSGFNSFENYSKAAQRVSLDIGTILRLIVFTYGPTLIFLGVTGIAVLVMIIKVKAKTYKPNPNLLILPIFILILVVIGASSLFLNLIAENPIRYLNYAIILSPVLISPVLYDYYIVKLNKTVPFMVISFIILMLIFCGAIIGVFNIYFSPITGEAGNGYSYALQAGIQRFMESSSNNDGRIYSINGDNRIFYTSRPLGLMQQFKNESPRWEVDIVPAHFGYQGMPDAQGHIFTNPEYLYITSYDYHTYTNVWPEGGRMTPIDFKFLDIDSKWNKVYDSGDFSLYSWR
jgi:hypothetical protein